jgi:hypothetical protein
MYTVLYARMMQKLLEEEKNKLKGFHPVKNELKAKLRKKKKDKQTFEEFLKSNNLNQEEFKSITGNNVEISKLLVNFDHFTEKDFYSNLDSIQDNSSSKRVNRKLAKTVKEDSKQNEIRNYVKESYHKYSKYEVDKENKPNHGREVLKTRATTGINSNQFAEGTGSTFYTSTKPQTGLFSDRNKQNKLLKEIDSDINSFKEEGSQKSLSGVDMQRLIDFPSTQIKDIDAPKGQVLRKIRTEEPLKEYIAKYIKSPKLQLYQQNEDLDTNNFKNVSNINFNDKYTHPILQEHKEKEICKNYTSKSDYLTNANLRPIINSSSHQELIKDTNRSINQDDFIMHIRNLNNKNLDLDKFIYDLGGLSKSKKKAIKKNKTCNEQVTKPTVHKGTKKNTNHYAHDEALLFHTARTYNPNYTKNQLTRSTDINNGHLNINPNSITKNYESITDPNTHKKQNFKTNLNIKTKKSDQNIDQVINVKESYNDSINIETNNEANKRSNLKTRAKTEIKESLNKYIYSHPSVYLHNESYKPKQTIIRMDYEEQDLVLLNKIESNIQRVPRKPGFNKQPLKQRSSSFDFPQLQLPDFSKIPLAFSQCFSSFKRTEKEITTEYSIIPESSISKIRNLTVSEHQHRTNNLGQWISHNMSPKNLNQIFDMAFLTEKKTEVQISNQDYNVNENLEVGLDNLTEDQFNIPDIEEEVKTLPKLYLSKPVNEKIKIIDNNHERYNIIEEIKVDIDMNDYLDTDEFEKFENILKTKPIKCVDHRKNQKHLSRENRKYEITEDNFENLSSAELNNILTIKDNILEEGSYLNFKRHKENSFVEDDDKTNFIDAISSHSKSKQSNITNFKRDIPLAETPPMINFKLKKDLPSNCSTFIRNSSTTTPNRNTRLGNFSESINFVMPNENEKKEQITFRRTSQDNVLIDSEYNRASRNVYDIYNRLSDERVMTQSSDDLLERGGKAINTMKNKIISQDGNIIISTVSKDESKKTFTDLKPQHSREISMDSVKTDEFKVNKSYFEENEVDSLEEGVKDKTESDLEEPIEQPKVEKDITEDLIEDNYICEKRFIRLERLKTDPEVSKSELLSSKVIIPRRSRSARAEWEIASNKAKSQNHINSIDVFNSSLIEPVININFRINNKVSNSADDSLDRTYKSNERKLLKFELINQPELETNKETITNTMMRSSIPQKAKTVKQPSNVNFTGTSQDMSKRSLSGTHSNFKSFKTFSNSNNPGKKKGLLKDRALSQFDSMSRYYSGLESGTLSYNKSLVNEFNKSKFPN